MCAGVVDLDQRPASKVDVPDLGQLRAGAFGRGQAIDGHLGRRRPLSQLAARICDRLAIACPAGRLMMVSGEPTIDVAFQSSGIATLCTCSIICEIDPPRPVVVFAWRRRTVDVRPRHAPTLAHIGAPRMGQKKKDRSSFNLPLRARIT